MPPPEWFVWSGSAGFGGVRFDDLARHRAITELLDDPSSLAVVNGNECAAECGAPCGAVRKGLREVRHHRCQLHFPRLEEREPQAPDPPTTGNSRSPNRMGSSSC